MGLDFIRDKKAKFDQQVDASLSKELDTDLLSAAYVDDEVQLFRCQQTSPDADLSVSGFRLIIRVFDATTAVVQRSARNVGVVVPEDTVRLVELMKSNTNSTGIIPVLVVESPDISGEFRVRPVTPFKH